MEYSALYYSLPGIAILVIAESVEMIREHRFGKDKNEMFASVFIAIGAIAVSSAIKGLVVFIYTWMYQFRLVTLSAGWWWHWVICFFADDLSFYWFHRCSHHIRFFWASHIVHHSPQQFTFTSGMRVPWTSHLTGNFLFYAWMPLLGISPAMVMTMKSVSVIYQLWLHTEKIKKMPKFFEAMFNTPSHHRVHHGCDVDYLDRNYGGTLIIWDHLFGTFRKESHKATYGLTKNINSNNPFVISFSEWGNLIKDLRKAKTPRDRFNFIFNSPGWSNDENCSTTKKLRKKAENSIPLKELGLVVRGT